MEFVLSEFPRHTRHVRGLPCEDVSILTEELDERSFLCRRQVGPDSDLLALVALDDIDLPRVLGGLETGQRGAISVGLLQDGVVVRVSSVLGQFLGVVHLFCDYRIGEDRAGRLTFDDEVGVASDGDDATGSGDLHHVVCIVGRCHEFGK